MLKYYVLSILLLLGTSVCAQNLKFTAAVSSSQVSTGEQFEVSFSINGEDGPFTPPSFAGFQVLSGPNLSSSTTIINGSVSASTSYSYILMATKEGTFTIGSASMVAEGKQLKSNPVKITVVKGNSVPQTVPPGTQEAYKLSEARKYSGDTKPLFIKAEVDKTNVFQGEQIALTYKLYTLVSLVGNELDKLPELNGFWSQDLNKNKQTTEWKTENYRGQEYHVAAIKETILFPQRAGKLIIDPLAMTFVARQQVDSDDVFDQFFGSFEEVRHKLKSQPITINVKALPLAGKPQDFSGAVGKFFVDASLDKYEVRANEAVNYKLRVTGTGNINLLGKLNSGFPEDFDKYDPKITDSLKENLSGISGTRIYNYLLIPRHQGNYIINPIKFSYFNPSSGKYITLTTKTFPVKVNKGETGDNAAVFAGGQEDVRLLGKDIRYIKTSDLTLYKKGEGFYGSTLFYLLLCLGPVAAGAAFIYKKQEEKLNADVVQVKSRRAGKIASKHMAAAEKQLTAKNIKAFYDEVFKGLHTYLSNKLNLPYSQLDKDIIAEKLKFKGIGENLIDRLIETLNLCEMARFSPVSSGSENQVFNQSKSIIADIEQKL